jgi:hypothetical protein
MPRVEPENPRVLGKTEQVESLGDEVELAAERRDAAQSAAVPALGKQKEELGFHSVAARRRQRKG